jgi:NADH-quinone oxidoreductase subunit C
VVYILRNLSTCENLRVKLMVEESDPRVATVSGIWATANWMERECWDLMGISFIGHPDLRRILMAADWVGHPLRNTSQKAGRD